MQKAVIGKLENIIFWPLILLMLIGIPTLFYNLQKKKPTTPKKISIEIIVPSASNLCSKDNECDIAKNLAATFEHVKKNQ